MQDPAVQELVQEIQDEMANQSDIDRSDLSDAAPPEVFANQPSNGANGHNAGSKDIDPLADAEPISNPTIVVEPPSTSPKRKVRSRSTVQAKQPGAAEINAVLGSTISFKFSKIEDNGTSVHINEFTRDDLRPCGFDIERFIRENLLPSYGPGAYWVTGKDEKGNEVKGKRYNIAAPYKVPMSGGVPSTSPDPRILDRLLAKIESTPREDPIGQFMKLQELMGSKNDSMPLMLMMMQQQKSNPELEILKLQLEQMRNQPQPLPPPPPPPPSLMEQIGPFMPVLTQVVQKLVDKPKEPGFIEQAAQLMTVFGPMVQQLVGSRSSAADEVHKLQLEHLKEKIEDLATGPDNISATIENLRSAKELFKEIGAGPAESSVKYFFENFQGNMHALSGAVKAMRGAEDQPRIGPGQVQQPQQLPQAPPQEADMPPLPSEFHDIMVKISEATSDEARLYLMLEALKVLHTIEAYKPIPIKLFSQVKMGLRDQFAHSVELFMNDLVANELLSKQDADKVTAAAKEHFDDIRQLVRQTGEKKPEAEEEDDGGEAEE